MCLVVAFALGSGIHGAAGVLIGHRACSCGTCVPPPSAHMAPRRMGMPLSAVFRALVMRVGALWGLLCVWLRRLRPLQVFTEQTGVLIGQRGCSYGT